MTATGASHCEWDWPPYRAVTTFMGDLSFRQTVLLRCFWNNLHNCSVWPRWCVMDFENCRGAGEDSAELEDKMSSVGAGKSGIVQERWYMWNNTPPVVAEGWRQPTLSGAADWRGPPLTLTLKQDLQFALTNAWWRSIHSFLGVVFTSRVGYRWLGHLQWGSVCNHDKDLFCITIYFIFPPQIHIWLNKALKQEV